MTGTLRVVLIVVSILTTMLIMRKIRNAKLQIEDSIFWIGFSCILIVFSLFPMLPAALSDFIGTQTPVNFIYLSVIFLLMMKMFHMSIKMSQLESRIRELVQEMALEENRRWRRERALKDAEATSGEDGTAGKRENEAGWKENGNRTE